MRPHSHPWSAKGATGAGCGVRLAVWGLQEDTFALPLVLRVSLEPVFYTEFQRAALKVVDVRVLEPNIEIGHPIV